MSLAQRYNQVVDTLGPHDYNCYLIQKITDAELAYNPLCHL